MPYRRRLERLVATVQQLSLARTLDDIVQIVRSEVRELTGADGATFVLRDGNFCHYVDENAIAPLWRGRRFPLETCISGWVMLHRTPVVIEDIYADPRIPVDAYRPTFVKSLAMVPIRTIQPLGAIGNYWADRRLPTDDEVKILQALADTTAVALANVQIYEQLEKREVPCNEDPDESPPIAARPVEKPPDAVRMCAWSKRLELDGEWLTPEQYLERRFGFQITHGMSEEVLATLLNAPQDVEAALQER